MTNVDREIYSSFGYRLPKCISNIKLDYSKILFALNSAQGHLKISSQNEDFLGKYTILEKKDGRNHIYVEFLQMRETQKKRTKE